MTALAAAIIAAQVAGAQEPVGRPVGPPARVEVPERRDVPVRDESNRIADPKAYRYVEVRMVGS